MRIGELAKAVDCHIETVRYYEKIGLIPASTKEPNGYRNYSEKHLQCLRLIRHARSLGFPQNEVYELVKLINIKDKSCRKVYNIVNRQIAVLDEKLKKINNMKDTLKKLSKSCKENKNTCPTINKLLQQNKQDY